MSENRSMLEALRGGGGFSEVEAEGSLTSWSRMFSTISAMLVGLVHRWKPTLLERKPWCITLPYIATSKGRWKVGNFLETPPFVSFLMERQDWCRDLLTCNLYYLASCVSEKGTLRLPPLLLKDKTGCFSFDL